MANTPFHIENYNLLTQNKWYLVVPLDKLQSELGFDNLILNLNGFTIPEMIIPSTDIKQMGTEFPYPTMTRNESKTLTVEYINSSNLYQYRLLYKWFSLIAKENGTGSKANTPNYYLNTTAFFLDEFKKPTVFIVYYGCWISGLSQLQLTYKTADNIASTFTMKYSYFEFKDSLE